MEKTFKFISLACLGLGLTLFVGCGTIRSAVGTASNIGSSAVGTASNAAKGAANATRGAVGSAAGAAGNLANRAKGAMSSEDYFELDYQGRIYVVGSIERAKQFQNTMSLNGAMTHDAAGPAGETVIVDGNDHDRLWAEFQARHN